MTLTHLSQTEKEITNTNCKRGKRVSGSRGWKGVIEVIPPQPNVTLVNLIPHADKCKICS